MKGLISTSEPVNQLYLHKQLKFLSRAQNLGTYVGDCLWLRLRLNQLEITVFNPVSGKGTNFRYQSPQTIGELILTLKLSGWSHK